MYLGHIPHGFYEEEMRKYFSQFGRVTRLKLSRSKKVCLSLTFLLHEVCVYFTSRLEGRRVSRS